ncbi:MAG: RNA polymerase sigma factor RpoD, partial [Microthrixaceae bacterium]|nr:RNA polymerase sigma factor RpoD [Microthrixaceae bacterium]
MSILDQVSESEWRGLIGRGKDRGTLTLDEVLSVLGVELTVDVLTDIEAALQPEGIELEVEVDPHTSDD